MKKTILLIIALSAVFFAGNFLFSGRESQFLLSKNSKEENIIHKNIKIGESTVKIEVAISEEDKKRGLSGREFLPEDQGLLFVFELPGFHSFWMKEMNFPIDIIWIGDNLEIIGIEENLDPDSYPQIFSPPKPTWLVLEVNAGWAKRHNAEAGMTAKFLDIR